MSIKEIGIMKTQSICPCGNITIDGRKCFRCWEKQIKSHPKSWKAYKNYWKEINKDYEKIYKEEERVYNLFYEKRLL